MDSGLHRVCQFISVCASVMHVISVHPAGVHTHTHTRRHTHFSSSFGLFVRTNTLRHVLLQCVNFMFQAQRNSCIAVDSGFSLSELSELTHSLICLSGFCFVRLYVCVCVCVCVCVWEENPPHVRGHIKTQGPLLGAWDSNSRLQLRISTILRHFIIIFCFVSAVIKVLFILLFLHVMHTVVLSPSGVHVPRQHHNEPHSSRSESQFEPFSYKFLARSPSRPAASVFVFNSGDNRVLQPCWAPNLWTLWTIYQPT